MKHFASRSFRLLLSNLPAQTQELARSNFDILKANPRHPSLRLKKIGDYWSVRVGRDYRALGQELEDGILWGWIGTHADYDKFLR